MSTIRKTLKDKDGNYFCPAIPSRSIEGGDIKLGAVKAENIDFTTLLFGNYSLEEQDTGFTWVDGKHIYKKTYIQECNSGNNRTIDISSLNIDTFLPMQVEGGWGGYGNINWPYYVSSGDNGRVFKNGDTLQFEYAFPDYNNRNVIVTIYYTKTS